MLDRRVVIPELLDGLAASDPAARRSRRDLRLIDFLMGNSRWIARQACALAGTGRIVEIGAGEGLLSRRMARRHRVTAVDLAPPPGDLAGVDWRRGDLFSILPGLAGDVLVGALILHHFSDSDLERLGTLLAKYRAAVFCEPWRAALPLAWGGLLAPFVGRVTRHDLPASVRAGFRSGELRKALGLKNWQFRESVDWRGAIRVVTWRS